MAKNLSKKQMAAIKAKQSKVVDIDTNRDNPLNKYPKKDFKLWIVDMNTKKKVPGSDTEVRSQHFGQAVDDFLITWNKQKRMGKTIGYPVIQGEEK